ncbi:16S rRNA (cytidine(1402)-2'-O)-methyltransferase [Candidatus Berkelbacteria bacterium]|nr:16S rRNA (cytidine(1402)-2'-O)-methyltransferase [Candidatus Berkelbacteria bacterium]
MSKLYVVATPIGNLGDISDRALSTLEQVSLILAEDTRTTKKLIGLYPNRRIEAQILRLDDSIQGIRLLNIVDQIAQGVEAALVSEAGTPQISDPGNSLINECIKRNIKVVPIPGPSALASIISVANFAVQPVIFYGFLPKKKGRVTTFEKLSKIAGKYGASSAVVYESPERMERTLTDILEYLGDKEMVIGRELTKKFEEIWYGKVSEALAHFKAPKGEFTLLIKLN